MFATAPQGAWAGACCAGATSTVPTRIGECEHVLVGVDVRAETSAGRWDARGALRGSSLSEQAIIPTLAVGWRWDRRGQIALTAPVWLNRKATKDEVAWGGGPGDVSLGLTWDPVEEARGPVPVFSGGVRLPTGRSWDRAQGALFEDVTGRPGVAATLGFAMERTLGAVPWSVGLGAELGPHDAVLTLAGSAGRYLGSEWSVLGTLRHVQVLGASGRTVGGFRVVWGRRLAWRAWAGAEADVPAPYLGHAAVRQVAVNGGLAWIR